MGTPKQYGNPINLRLTDEQLAEIKNVKMRFGINLSEALRLLLWKGLERKSEFKTNLREEILDNLNASD